MTELEGRDVPAPISVSSLLDDGSAGTLRAAIIQANTSVGVPDTIQFAPGLTGTITLNGTQLTITDELTITGPGAAQLAVSGNHTSRVFEIESGGILWTASISGLTIRDGVVAAGEAGGGILNHATLAVEDCIISGNTAGGGAGIYNRGTLTVTGSTFSGNTAETGAGIYSYSGMLTVTASTFLSNAAGVFGVGGFASYGGGGGIYVARDSKLTVRNSTFNGNTALQGGGIAYRASNLLTVSNSTFAGNSAGIGGAIFQSAVSQLINVTIANNSADEGGGIYHESGSSLLSNTIIAGNRATTSGPDIYASVASRGYNLIGSIAGYQTRDSAGNITVFGTPDRANGFMIVSNFAGDKIGLLDGPINPLLAPLGSYGGPTQTMPPLPNSPALDASSNALAREGINTGAYLTTDQRGFARIVKSTDIDPATVDMGAAEYQGSQDPAYDGVSDDVENDAPNGGDGNGDGKLDSTQANVTSLPNAETGSYVTLASSDGTSPETDMTSLVAVRAVKPGEGGVAPLPTTLSKAILPVGGFTFTLEGATPAPGTTTVTLYMPTGVNAVKVNKYLKYGLEPTDDPLTTAPHWWDFTRTSTTGPGAEIFTSHGITTKIVLHFVDGERGDGDRVRNGVIVDPGAPVLVPVEVQIDVRSTVNLASQGRIAVAIFSTADFDAALVNAASVQFAGAAAVQFSLEDVNGDGLLDMVLQFRTQDTNLRALYEQLLADDINGDGVLDSSHQEATITLSGTTTGDQQFEGSDTIDLFLSGKNLRDMLAELAASGAI
jgi:hypothetical protein